MGSLKFFLVFWGIQQTISVPVPCNQPLLRFTDNCNDANAIDWFQFEGGKKINFKKPLKGKVKITIDSGRSDVTRLKKCLVLSVTSVSELSVNFQDNNVVGKVILRLTNGTKIEVNTDENGRIQGVQKLFDDEDNLEEISTCDLDFKWYRKNKSLQWLTLSKMYGNSMLHSKDWQVFVLCKGVSEHVVVGCAKIQSHQLVNHNGFITLADNANDNLVLHHYVQDKLYSEENVRDKCAKSTTLNEWFEFIGSFEIVPYFYDKVKDALIDQNVHEFQTELDLSMYPKTLDFNEATLNQNGVKLFTGKPIRSINGKNTFRFTKIKSDLFFQPHIESTIEVKPIELGVKIENTDNTDNTITFKGFICKHGHLCGLVKRFGQILRDYSFCTDIAQVLAYVGFHNPEGHLVGPSFDVLHGNSVIYNLNSGFPTENAAYIYYGGNFAIYGSFDENKQLIKGSKVRHKLEGCDDNLMPEIQFSTPAHPEISYHYKPPNNQSFGDQPLVNDEIGEEYLEIKNIDGYKGEGLFAKVDIPPNTLIAQYGGFRITNGGYLDHKYIDPQKPYSYLHKVPFIGNEQIKLDIPHGFEPIEKYCATYGHKINHSFGTTHVGYSYVSKLFCTKRHYLYLMYLTGGYS